jgi:farnesol dehydrogenase
MDAEPGRLAAANQYVRSKTEGTRRLRALQKSGHPLILLYPTVILGPGRLSRGNHTARVLADIGRGRFPGLVGNGEQIWNLVPVRDAARGHVLALEKGGVGEGYILGGENWTQRRLIERAAHHFGIAPPVRRLGRALPWAVGLACEIWNRFTGRAPYLTRGEVLLYDADWAVTSAKAERDLGYRPAGVDETLAATVAWLQRDVLGRLR